MAALDEAIWGFSPLGSHSDGDDISAATVLSPATLAVREDATKVMIQALTQNVRYTLDGTTPTASAGFQLAAGDPPVIIMLNEGVTLTVIEEAATADLQYQWGK